MESISIKFLESQPEGLRRITTNNWSGRCLVISRKNFLSAQRTGKLIRSGVYILVGPSEIRKDHRPPKLEWRIYIGKSDILDERLRQHYDSKEFWTTAFAFYREEDLHGGETAELEALLIAKAKSAGTHVLANVVAPRQLQDRTESEESATFFVQAESMLKALGYDFFSPENQPDLISEVATKATKTFVIPGALQGLVNQLRLICLGLPQTEVYETHVPDIRAKLAHGERSRVFARIQFQKKRLKLTFKGGPTLFVSPGDDLDASIKSEIRSSYDRALQKLSRIG